jgi:hypothetical protein
VAFAGAVATIAFLSRTLWRPLATPHYRPCSRVRRPPPVVSCCNARLEHLAQIEAKNIAHKTRDVQRSPQREAETGLK